MKKKEKTVCQIIRFWGKIEAFLVSIDEFAISSLQSVFKVQSESNNRRFQPGWNLCKALFEALLLLPS